MSAVLSIKESPKNIWYVTCRIRTFAEGTSVLRLPLQTKAPIGCSGSWVLADALYQLSRIFYIHMQSFGRVQWLLQHPICYTWVRPCSKNYMREEDVKLDAVRARFSNVLKRHSELAERLSRDSDKSIFERLQREFEAARASQTQELNLEGEQWNDGLLATIRERVHIEAERKAMQMPGDTTQLPIPFHDKITYKVGNKVICCLDGARIGIQYDTSFAGESCDLYHCVLESKSFLEKMTVLEHTVPFFLPIREAENEFLSSNAIRFIDHVGDLLQAYVDRREQVRLIKELYGNQIGELYHSLPYHMIEFVLEDFDSKVTVGLRYADLISTLPTGVSVLAWPMYKSKRSSNTNSSSQKGNGAGSPPIPARLTYAEDALRTMSLPEAYAEIVLNLPQALQDMFPHTSST